MASIKEVPTGKIIRFERVGAHTHIRGLGLDKKGNATKIKDGMVEQEEAREAAGLVVKMIKEGKLSGKTIIFAGPPGTGKTAIAVAVSKELGQNVPFIQMSGSEVYSSERKKTEVLMGLYASASALKFTKCEKSTKAKSRTSTSPPRRTLTTPTKKSQRASA